MKILLITEDINIKNELNKVFDENSTIKLLRQNSLEKIKQILLKNSFDLIISDTKINGLSGFDVLKLRNKYHQEVKFVFYSKDKSLNTIKKAFKNNADDYIIKPELKNLIKYINSLQKKDRASKKFSQNINKQKVNITNFSDNFPLGIFQTDKYGRTIYVNREWSKISGLSSNEALGDGWLKAVHPDDREILIKNWKSRARSKKTSSAVYRFLRPDGNIVWVQGFAAPQKDKNGRILGYIGSIINITAQKNIVNEIEESKKRFSLLFEASPIGMMIVDKSFNVLEVNEVFTKIFGYSKRDIGNIRNFYKISHSDKTIQREIILKWQQILDELIFNHNSITVEYPVICKNCEEKIIESTFTSTDDFIFITFSDITQKKQTELSLSSRLEKIQLLNQLSLNLQEDLDIREIIKHSYEIIPKFLKVDRVSIFVYEPKIDGLISEKYIGQEIDKNNVIYQPINISISGKCFREGEIVVVENCKKSDLIPQKYVKQLNLKSSVAIPLKASGKSIGVIRLDFTEKYHKFSDEEIEFYKLLGLQLGAIIRNSQLFSEQNAITKKLKESNERYFLTIEATEEGIWDWNVITNEVYFSPQWKRQIGYEDHELKNAFETWVEHLHPDEREARIQAVKNYLQNPTKYFIQEFRLRHKDGSYRWIHNRASSLLDDKGNVIRMFGAHTDITEKKIAESKIIESEKQFRTLFERAADAILIADIETGKILDANFAACNLLNKTKEQIIGLHQSELHPPEISESIKEIFQDHIKQTEIEGTSKPVETLVQRSDGSTVEVEILASQINYKDKKCLLGLFRDISLRKKAEKEIRESERKLRSLIETTIEGICTTDANDIITYVNPVFSKLLKYETDELIGKNFKDLISPSDLKNYCSQQELRKSGQSAVYEISLINKDKEVLWFIISATPVFDENGNFTGSFGMFTNITEKKLVEEAIKHSEQRFRSIWENSFDAMRLANSNGIIIDVNDAFCRLFNKSKDEIIGIIFYNLYKDVDIDSYLKKFKENFKNNSINSLLEAKIVTWNDEVKWVSLSNSFIYDSNGEKLLLSIFRDITKNKLAEEEIKKLYRGIEHSPVSILITDTEGVIEYVNPKFCEVSGYSLSEVLGMKPSLLKSGLMEKSFYKNLWETITSGNVWQGEFLNKRKNGDLFWESALIAPVTDEEGKIINYIGIKEDITEKKMLFEQLILAKEKAEESNRLKSNFLANMSHELRTPLNGILGYAEILKEDSNDPIIKDYASIIFRSGRRLLETLNLILDYSKIESEKVEAKFEYQNIQFLLKEIYKLHLPNALKKKLDFNFESEFEEVLIKTDVQIFNSIFNNLVNNAIKFTEKGSVSIKLKKSIHNEQNCVCIIVEDTGIGISKEQQSIIWEPFRQLSEGKSRSHEGTGLGLAIVKNYVKTLNGEIELESDLGKGSKFSIYFPF
ncbi:MAG: PAS domain S-box protein [Ignavibacterium sp.]|nr:PAS domain S-box protein [Ignavibacterium sp.]MDW8375922.1 PAS domain S-box protein [Ignavibacteriales bacterium]